jgi:hypothetical protein
MRSARLARDGPAFAKAKNLQFLALNFAFLFLANSIVLSRPRYHFSMMPFLLILAALGGDQLPRIRLQTK